MSDVTEATAPPAKLGRGKYPRKPKAPKAPDVMRSPRSEVHSTDFQIGQHSTITDHTAREDVGRERFDPKQFSGRLKKGKDDFGGEILLLDKIEVTPEYLAELAFYEEPLTIIINPSTQRNAATIFENWCNGRGAEMLLHGQWQIIRDLPVGRPITVKRKIVEHIIRARVMNLQTMHEEPPVPSPRNEIYRQSTPAHSFSILRDDSPRSQAWLEMAYARPI